MHVITDDTTRTQPQRKYRVVLPWPGKSLKTMTTTTLVIGPNPPKNQPSPTTGYVLSACKRVWSNKRFESYVSMHHVYVRTAAVAERIRLGIRHMKNEDIARQSKHTVHKWLWWWWIITDDDDLMTLLNGLMRACACMCAYGCAHICTIVRHI